MAMTKTTKTTVDFTSEQAQFYIDCHNCLGKKGIQAEQDFKDSFDKLIKVQTPDWIEKVIDGNYNPEVFKEISYVYGTVNTNRYQQWYLGGGKENQSSLFCKAVSSVNQSAVTKLLEKGGNPRQLDKERKPMLRVVLELYQDLLYPKFTPASIMVCMEKHKYLTEAFRLEYSAGKYPVLEKLPSKYKDLVDDVKYYYASERSAIVKIAEQLLVYGADITEPWYVNPTKNKPEAVKLNNSCSSTSTEFSELRFIDSKLNLDAGLSKSFEHLPNMIPKLQQDTKDVEAIRIIDMAINIALDPNIQSDQFKIGEMDRLIACFITGYKAQLVKSDASVKAELEKRFNKDGAVPGKKTNAGEPTCETLLLLAVKAGLANTTFELVSHGVNVELYDHQAVTPLVRAVLHKDLRLGMEITKILLKKGNAKINAKVSKTSYMPISYLLDLRFRDFSKVRDEDKKYALEFVKLLLTNGALMLKSDIEAFLSTCSNAEKPIAPLAGAFNCNLHVVQALDDVDTLGYEVLEDETFKEITEFSNDQEKQEYFLNEDKRLFGRSDAQKAIVRLRDKYESRIKAIKKHLDAAIEIDSELAQILLVLFIPKKQITNPIAHGILSNWLVSWLDATLQSNRMKIDNTNLIRTIVFGLNDKGLNLVAKDMLNKASIIAKNKDNDKPERKKFIEGLDSLLGEVNDGGFESKLTSSSSSSTFASVPSVVATATSSAASNDIKTADVSNSAPANNSASQDSGVPSQYVSISVDLLEFTDDEKNEKDKDKAPSDSSHGSASASVMSFDEIIKNIPAQSRVPQASVEQDIQALHKGTAKSPSLPRSAMMVSLSAIGSAPGSTSALTSSTAAAATNSKDAIAIAPLIPSGSSGSLSDTKSASVGSASKEQKEDDKKEVKNDEKKSDDDVNVTSEAPLPPPILLLPVSTAPAPATDDSGSKTLIPKGKEQPVALIEAIKSFSSSSLTIVKKDDAAGSSDDTANLTDRLKMALSNMRNVVEPPELNKEKAQGLEEKVKNEVTIKFDLYSNCANFFESKENQKSYPNLYRAYINDYRSFYDDDEIRGSSSGSDVDDEKEKKKDIKKDEKKEDKKVQKPEGRTPSKRKPNIPSPNNDKKPTAAAPKKENPKKSPSAVSSVSSSAQTLPSVVASTTAVLTSILAGSGSTVGSTSATDTSIPALPPPLELTVAELTTSSSNNVALPPPPDSTQLVSVTSSDGKSSSSTQMNMSTVALISTHGALASASTSAASTTTTASSNVVPGTQSEFEEDDDQYFDVNNSLNSGTI